MYVYEAGNMIQKVIRNCTVSCKSLFKLISSD